MKKNLRDDQFSNMRIQFKKLDILGHPNTHSVSCNAHFQIVNSGFEDICGNCNSHFESDLVLSIELAALNVLLETRV